ETGALPPAALARALLLMDMHGIGDLAQLHEQVLHHRLWHWFVAGTHGVMDSWQLPALRVAMGSWCDDAEMTDALAAF
ncbi:transposase, partial [Enterobacter hormaechei]